ncbi:amino acid adenylation domain-containing protein [Streptomyces sp. NBC_01255]|uniref:amino acid adenylation domain-containing protein n=1 Tax=Streptomyces sp. NBC_01255 TaxID=2903798 RepID=UPI002E31CAE6|nr:amino acid adenylation domain-containing protein [Streptomyces sp. NBC_01255]
MSSRPAETAATAARDSAGGEEFRQWTEQVRAALPERPLGLGGDRPVPAGPAARVRLTLDASLRAAVGRTAHRHGVNPLTVGLSALALTLVRHTAVYRQVIATSDADVPVLLDVREDMAPAELFATAHAALGRSRDLALTPGQVPAVPLEFTYGVQGPATPPLAPSAAGDVHFALLHTDDGGAELTAAFPAERYTPEQLTGFLTHLRAALTALTEEPGSGTPPRELVLRELVLLDASAREELLALGRGQELPEEGREPVHTRVARLRAEDPTAPAAVCGDDEADRGELDAWASRIASRLLAAGVGRGDRVGLLAERSLAAVAATLGILRAGAAYVPVDPANPDERVASVLTDAGVSAVVVTGRQTERLTGSLARAVVRADAPELRTPEDAGASAAEHTDTVPATAAPEDPAYLIYTSGSTGAPKGVLVEHGQLAASTLARRQVYPGAPVFLLLPPLAFDSSAAGLWGTLTAGGRLVVAGEDEYRDPDQLVRLVERHRVTHLLCVPSLYGMVLAAAERAGLHRLASLTTVTVAGEALPQALLSWHLEALPGTTLVNEYGPTETTVWATHGRSDLSRTTDIGGPVPGVRLYVLDDERRLVPRGVTGELYIGGAGVSRGYFGRPDSTERAFLADPFAADSARMYRTGDLVRWNDAGTLDFLGRRDNQVKIRGHRVELGAVETALRSCPGIREAVVVPDSALTGLVGFVLADEATDTALTRKELATKLPEAAVPGQLRVLDAFPVTANGKADRKALAELIEKREQMNQTGPETSTAAAPGDTLAQVTAAWAEVLNVTDVPPTVNFFELGGHSLMMVRLQATLERLTGVRPSPLDLYRCTTVEAQVELIRSGAASAPAGGARTDGSAERVRRAWAARARRARSLDDGQAQR